MSRRILCHQECLGGPAGRTNRASANQKENLDKRVEVLVTLEKNVEKTSLAANQQICGGADVLSFLISQAGDDISCTRTRDTKCSGSRN